jgi:hypothetical protein
MIVNTNQTNLRLQVKSGKLHVKLKSGVRDF